MSIIPDYIRNGTYYTDWEEDVQYTPQMKFGGVNNAPLFYSAPIVKDDGIWYICKGPTIPTMGVHPVDEPEAWELFAVTGGEGVGTVTLVSVNTANGMAGTVATATTTPAITLTTTVNGIVKGNGTALSAAVSGTDYLVPGVTVAQGGTGLTTASTPFGVICAGTTGTGNFQILTLGTTGQVLTSNGAGALPTWETNGSGSGTVTDFVFTNGNGINGVVSTSTSTPTLALSTPLTGMVYANGTAFTAVTNAAGALINNGSGTMSYQAIATANTVSTIVARDGSGNFSAGTITAALTGNASTATALQTARSIYGSNFDGSADLDGPVETTYGGTGLDNTTATLHGILISEGASPFNPIVLGNQQFLMGNTSADPSAVNLTAGSGITIEYAGSDVTISSDAESSGIAPYNSELTYNAGNLIRGDGTNGLLGIIYTCVGTGITGAFNTTNWFVGTGLDLADVGESDFNVFDNTGITYYTSVTGFSNYFSGIGCGGCYNLSGEWNDIRGFSAFQNLNTDSTISGSNNSGTGGYSLGGVGGLVTSASNNTFGGFQALGNATTATYCMVYGNQAGKLVDVGYGQMIFGGYQGTSGATDNNKFILYHPDPTLNAGAGQEILVISDINAPLTANSFLATPDDGTGSIGLRPISLADLPSESGQVENGTFNPTLVGWTNVGSPTVTGKYTVTKDGAGEGIVSIFIKIVPDTSVSSTVLTSTITGLPFTANASFPAVLSVADYTTGDGLLNATVVQNTTTINPPTISVTADTIIISGTYSL